MKKMGRKNSKAKTSKPEW